MKKLALSLCGIIFSSCLMAGAQKTPAPAPAPASSQEAEVGPLYIYVMGQWAKTTNFGKDAADMIVAKLKLNMQNDPQLKGVMSNAFIADLQQFIYELFISPQSLTKMAALYSQYFSIDEMQELLKFYNTPLGQKLVKTDAEITIKTQEIGMQLLKLNEKRYMEIVAKHLGKTRPPTATPDGKGGLPTTILPGTTAQEPIIVR